MSTPNDSDDLEHPQDAAHWFARMHSGEATEAQRRAFEAWRHADPVHDRQYRNLHFIWEASSRVPAHRLRRILAQSTQSVRAPMISRRQFGLGLAGACSLAIVAGIANKTGWMSSDRDTLHLATRRGERRQIRLSDGSELDLNTDTVAVVRFSADQRHIELLQGEIFFDVQSDTRRPFLVDAEMGQVTVTGTRFNVRRDEDVVHVSVQSGSVRVQSGHWWNRTERHLTANQAVLAHQNQPLSDVRPAHINDVIAWQRGKIVFNNAPLHYVVSEMNRYLAYPARLDAPYLRDHRISGIFSVDEPHAMIDALPAIAPVTVQRLSDGEMRILAR